MRQKYYFLTGFPRSGNTLLSTILNQNKDIATSGHSYAPQVFFNLETIKYDDKYNYFPAKDSLKEIQKNVLFNFYKKWKQKYIINRGEWATPFNYNMLKQYCPNEIKLIFLVRNPVEIITSYLNLCNNYPDFYINLEYNQMDKTALHRSEIEEKIELITKKNSLFDFSCMAYNFIKNNEDVLFIDYNNLIKNPENNINKIYSFLKIPKFKHCFNITEQFSINNIKYDDTILKAPMHTLKTGELKKTIYNQIKIPNYIIEKYKNFIKE